MIYVLDSNVALKWVLPEADSDKALQLRTESEAGLHELLAPDFFPVEVAHALTRAERRGDLAPGDADLHLLNILSTSPRYHPALALLRRFRQPPGLACTIASTLPWPNGKPANS